MFTSYIHNMGLIRVTLGGSSLLVLVHQWCSVLLWVLLVTNSEL
jgi:hypothetical protein